MTAFPDDRIRFYLQHEEIIDTWAALADDARAALSKWLVDLRGDVDKIGARRGAISSHFERWNWAGHRLANSTWLGQSAEDPPVTVELQWNPSTIKVPSRPPRVALSIGPSGEVGDRRREDFHDRFNASIRAMKDYEHGGRGHWYQALRDLPPEESASPWWDHLDDYRAFLLAGLDQAWTDLSPLVEEWLPDAPAVEPAAAAGDEQG